MQLRTYLDREKIKPLDFAATIKVSGQSLYRYMAGERFPRGEVLDKIVEHTRGAVGAADFHEACRSTRIAA